MTFLRLLFVLVVLLVGVTLVKSKTKALSCYTCSDVLTNGALIPVLKVWRDDTRCGPSYLLSDGSPARCNPDDLEGRTCCSKEGWCGGSSLHCCPGCLNFSRSNKDHDMPVCSGGWDTAKTPCSTSHTACSRVKISTNTIIPGQYRNQTIRRCHVPTDEPLCTKYTNAGHYCDESLCYKNNCNEASRTILSVEIIYLFIFLFVFEVY